MASNTPATEATTAPKDHRLRYVVGIDFGTSFSGFAFAKADEDQTLWTWQSFPSERITCYENWTGSTIGPYPKTKTALFYKSAEDNDPAWGWDASAARAKAKKPPPQSWQFQENFKLHLAQRTDVNPPPLPPHKTDIDVR